MDGATRGGQAARPIKRGRGGASSSAAFARKLAGAAGLFKPAEHDEGSEGDTSDGGDAGSGLSAKRLGKRPAAAASSSRNEEISFSRDGSVVDGDAEAARKSRFEVTVTENRYQAVSTAYPLLCVNRGKRLRVRHSLNRIERKNAVMQSLRDSFLIPSSQSDSMKLSPSMALARICAQNSRGRSASFRRMSINGNSCGADQPTLAGSIR